VKRAPNFIFSLLGLTLLFRAVLHTQVLDLEYYTTREGLVSHGVNDIFQDSLGRLWIGTSDGLSIYDGSEFRNYRSDDGLPLDFINCIAACRESPTAAWIGTLGGGICKLVDDRFSYITLGSDRAANNITALLEDRRGSLWVGTVEGLYRIDSSKVTRYPLEGSENGVSGLAETDDGRLWVGLSRAAALLKQNQPPQFFSLGLGDDASTMSMDERGSVWVGTANGFLVRLDPDGSTQRARISTKGLHDVTTDGNGVAWICAQDGLFTLDGGQLGQTEPVRFGRENGFAGEFFFCASFDREENLWIGGLGMGLYKLRDRALWKFPLLSLSLEQGFNSVAVDSPTHLWVVDGEGLNELWLQPNSPWGRRRHAVGSGKIRCLEAGGDNTLWVGFLNQEIHLYRIQHGKNKSLTTLRLLRKLRPGKELPQEPWGFFVVDRMGALWLRIHPVGVIVLDGNNPSKRTTLTPPEGVPHADVRAIHEDRNGDIWIGGLDGGIVVYRRIGTGYTLVRKLASGTGLDDDRIRSIYVDSLGQCWTGTRWGGITVTNGTTWRSLTTSDGILSKAVLAIAQDSRGTIWIGTPLGLQGIDAKSFRLTKTIAGLVGESIGSCGTVGNFVWTFTTKFLAVYDLSKAQTNTSPPLVSIREFRVNGTRRSTLDLLELSHGENNIAIDFAGISLKNEKGVRYQYRLLGAEENLSPPTPYRMVTYAALDAGAYTFEVQAINSDGVQSTSPASVSFTILPPIWERWWFQLGAVIFVVGLLWAVHRYRVSKLLEIERTRIRIARDLHDEIGSTLSSISYFAQAVRSGREGTGTGNPDRLLSLIVESSSKAKSAISDIIWSIDPSNDTWEELLARMRRHASDVLESKGIRYRIDLPEKLAGNSPTMQQRRHLWLLFKEIVANAAQHSGCTTVDIDMKASNGVINLDVNDNGNGFDQETVTRGTGLKSIRDRADDLGATLQLDTGPGKGTRWSVRWRQ